MTPAVSADPMVNYSRDSFVEKLLTGGTLLPDTPHHVMEVVGILASYGIVLDAYSKNLNYIAEHQFLVLFPFFKYFDGEVTPGKLLRHLWHDRINFEYAEYCMRTMMWHGGGGLDQYLDTPAFQTLCERAVQAKIKLNPPMQLMHRLFPGFLPEQVRQLAYYSGLGQFWRVMSDIFMSLSDRYDRGEITSIPAVVDHIKAGLVADAGRPITYAVEIKGQRYDLLPASAGLTFLPDTAIPYVEAVFFRGTPFLGTVSYNAQVHQISPDQSRFTYGALYADPLPTMGSGIPPSLLMQDMYRHLPEYLHRFYRTTTWGEHDIHVKICETFQRSMFCVTNAALMGLLPHPADTPDPQAQAANRQFLRAWMDRLSTSRLDTAQS